MVFPLLAVGIGVLVGRTISENRTQRKANERRELESMTSAPAGYAPQYALLFDYPLEPGESLVATFEYTPCKWTKEMFASADMFPRPLGMTLGIGHITTKRVLLFYDLERIEGKTHWSHGQVETLGKWGSKILEHGVNETLGHIFEGMAHIDAETREHMERVAEHFTYGVVDVPRGGDWGIAFGHVFYDMSSGTPNKPMTFSPDFIDSNGSGNRVEIFKKLLTMDGYDEVEFEKQDEFPYYGSRSALERDVL